MKDSQFLSLGAKDFLRGLLMAILVPFFTIVQQSLEAGVITFEWKSIAIASLAGAVAYLTKNFFTSSSQKSFLDQEAIGQPFPKKR